MANEQDKELVHAHHLIIRPKHLLLTFLIALALGVIGTYIVVNQDWYGRVDKMKAEIATQTQSLQKSFDELKLTNNQLEEKARKLLEGIRESSKLTDQIDSGNLNAIERLQKVIQVLKEVREILKTLLATN